MEFRPFCLDTVTDSQDLRIKEKESEKHILPSGIILVCDEKEYPVMLDLTDGYKFTCKEVTDEEWPDILCLINFAAGPLNLKLIVEEKEAENIKGKIEEEILTYKAMIRGARKFINNMPMKLERSRI